MAADDRREASDAATAFDYDLFVIYAKADAPFVHEVLMPAANLAPERALLVEDLTPGAPRVTEIERGIAGSRFTLIVLSHAYLADDWATFGELLANHLSVADPRLIPVRVDDCELPIRLELRVALDFRRREEHESEGARLRKLLATPAPAHVPGHRRDRRRARALVLGVVLLAGLGAAGAWRHARRGQPSHPAAARARLTELGWPYTPEELLRHVVSGDLETVRLFLEAGMTPNPHDARAISALGIAVERGDLPMTEALLAAGADIRSGPVIGDNALSVAIMRGQDQIAAAICRRPLDAEVVANAFIHAAYHGRLATLRVLLSKTTDLRRDGGGALRSAANVGQVKAVQLLLDAGVPIEAADDTGYTALLDAGLHGELETIELLLARGASVAARTADGDTPLHFAARYGYWTAGGKQTNMKVATLLLDHGAEVNARNGEGETPLTTAVRLAWPDDDVVRLLLDRGAEINGANKRAETPLYLAAYSGHESAVALLLDRGADIRARTTAGETVWDTLRWYNDAKQHARMRALLDRKRKGRPR
jgi:ankyrin repeat protein